MTNSKEEAIQTKMVTKNSNKLKLAKIKNIPALLRKNTFPLVMLQSFSISSVISAKKM